MRGGERRSRGRSIEAASVRRDDTDAGGGHGRVGHRARPPARGRSAAARARDPAGVVDGAHCESVGVVRGTARRARRSGRSCRPRRPARCLRRRVPGGPVRTRGCSLGHPAPTTRSRSPVRRRWPGPRPGRAATGTRGGSPSTCRRRVVEDLGGDPARVGRDPDRGAAGTAAHHDAGRHRPVAVEVGRSSVLAVGVEPRSRSRRGTCRRGRDASRRRRCPWRRRRRRCRGSQGPREPGHRCTRCSAPRRSRRSAPAGVGGAAIDRSGRIEATSGRPASRRIRPGRAVTATPLRIQRAVAVVASPS